MRRLIVHFALSLTLVGYLACVGDDPEVNLGGADAGTPPGDGSTVATDASSAGGDDAMSDASMTNDAAKPYDVRDLIGLRLWLESTKDLVAESGSTAFGSWSDNSAHWDGGVGAPDGGRHVALPHNVNPPSIVSNGFAGRPTVSFIAGNGYVRIDNHDDFQFGLGDFLIVEVAKVTSTTGSLWLLRPNATAGSEEALSPGQLCVSYGLGVNNGCTTPVFTPSTEPHVFAARRKSDVFTLRVDGSVRGTLDRSGDPPDIGVNVFAQPYAFIGSNATMQVSELVVIVGPTSDADLDGLEKHLKGKYAIP